MTLLTTSCKPLGPTASVGTRSFHGVTGVRQVECSARTYRAYLALSSTSKSGDESKPENINTDDSDTTSLGLFSAILYRRVRRGNTENSNNNNDGSERGFDHDLNINSQLKINRRNNGGNGGSGRRSQSQAEPSNRGVANSGSDGFIEEMVASANFGTKTCLTTRTFASCVIDPGDPRRTAVTALVLDLRPGEARHYGCNITFFRPTGQTYAKSFTIPVTLPRE